MLATSANGAACRGGQHRDQQRDFRPYGVCVLTVSGAGIRPISSFGDPGLVSVFGFWPALGQLPGVMPSWLSSST